MHNQQEFNPDLFDRDFERAADRCTELSRDEARQFVEQGHITVRDAFPRSIADAVVEQAWAELEQKHDVQRGEPDSWDKPFMFKGKGQLHGYVRTQATDMRFNLLEEAPRAFGAQADAVGGAGRLPDAGRKLAWSDAAVANLGVPGGSGDEPRPQLGGWHKDGWHFRHFLNSPEQGLLTVPIYSDIAADSGGTQVAADSIAVVASLLAAQPQGLHPDSVQGAGYLIPGLVEQCSTFTELTGAAGDMVILHPFMLHRACPNPSPRPRFIANAALVMAEPMCFARGPTDVYSLVELGVLLALRVNRLDFHATRKPRAVLPGPFREHEQAEAERKLLEAEMAELAAAGLRTPAWGPACGYRTNR